MGVIIKETNFVIITESKTINFDLPKDSGNNLKHEIDFIKKPNEILVEHTLKKEISQLLCKYISGNDIHQHGKQ